MDLISNNNSILNNFFLIFTSFIFSFLLVPVVKNFGLKFKILDDISQRKIHNNPIVRIGGLAIFLGYFFSIFIAYKLDFFEIGPYLPLLAGSFFMFLLGILDDLFQLSPFLRLIFQVLIFSFVFSSGLSISIIDFSLFGDQFQLFHIPLVLSYIITLLWIVGITNAINWLDGLDGLASGIASISTLGILITSYILNNFSIAIMASCLLGSILGFLRFNFKPASIYMGDGGSYLIGYLLASLSIYGSLNSNSSLIPQIPLLILFLPVIDMTIVIFKRILEGSSPFMPDMSHIHHRLLSKGFTEIKVVLILYFITLLTVIISLITLKT